MEHTPSVRQVALRQCILKECSFNGHCMYIPIGLKYIMTPLIVLVIFDFLAKHEIQPHYMCFWACDLLLVSDRLTLFAFSRAALAGS